MRRKLFIFSQFMYDEHIKARLVKDSRALRAAVSEQQQQRQEGTTERYSFERADKWNRNIRKLGVNADGESYLDQFRALITQVALSLCLRAHVLILVQEFSATREYFAMYSYSTTAELYTV